MQKENQNKNEGVLYCVYGTLRRGFSNYNRLLNNDNCEYLGTQRLGDEYKMVSLGGFPGVIPGQKGEITIEVFRVNSANVEQHLDWLEGYPSFYGKTEVDTDWGTANMYVLDEATYGARPLVESGDWKKHVNKLK